MEMDMQDSADMCGCMSNLDKLSREWRWQGRAESKHLWFLLSPIA